MCAILEPGSNGDKTNGHSSLVSTPIHFAPGAAGAKPMGRAFWTGAPGGWITPRNQVITPLLIWAKAAVYE